MYMLIPNVTKVEEHLNSMASIFDADEVLLFERATFLVIAHAERNRHRDNHRLARVLRIQWSNFKLK